MKRYRHCIRHKVQGSYITQTQNRRAVSRAALWVESSFWLHFTVTSLGDPTPLPKAAHLPACSTCMGSSRQELRMAFTGFHRTEVAPAGSKPGPFSCYCPCPFLAYYMPPTFGPSSKSSREIPAYSRGLCVSFLYERSDISFALGCSSFDCPVHVRHRGMARALHIAYLWVF